jgi:hypothetical protein
MPFFLSILAALRLGAPTAAAAPLEISVRAEARAVAAETELAPSALLEANHDLASAPHAPEWPGSAFPGYAPHFRAYQPEEWVAAVAQQLKTDHRLTNAALWVARWPVRVEMTPHRVFLAVRFRAP